MIPDPSTAKGPLVEDGSDGPAGQPPATRPGHIPCAVCTRIIYLDQYRHARCWTDPHGITCAAHVGCLHRLGETDLGLDAS